MVATFTDNLVTLVNQFRLQFKAWRLQCLLVPITFFSVIPIGYHLIVLNVPSVTVQHAILLEFRNEFGIDLSTVNLDFIWSSVIACQSIGALCSFVLIAPLERKFGAKRTLTVFNNGVLLVASVLFGLISKYTSTILLLSIGRLLIGVYTGLSCALVPIYIQEVAPDHLKGALCCFVHISICAGSALGALLSLESILGGASTWTILLALPLFFALANMVIGYFLYESPNHYIRLGENESAIESIKFYYGVEPTYDNDEELKSTTMSEKELLEHYQTLVTQLPPQLSIREAWFKPEIRRGILTGLMVSAVQVFSGSMAAVSYSTSMLESVSLMSWMTPLIPSLGALLSMLLTLPALRFVDTLGRKRLLVRTLWVCAVANFLLVLFSLLSSIGPALSSWTSLCFVASFFLYAIGYNLGVGPIAYFLAGELVPPEAVAPAMGCAVGVNWLATLLTTLLFYPVNALIGGWTFLFFAVPTALAAVYFNRVLPDDHHLHHNQEDLAVAVEGGGGGPSRNQQQSSPTTTFTLICGSSSSTSLSSSGIVGDERRPLLMLPSSHTATSTKIMATTTVASSSSSSCSGGTTTTSTTTTSRTTIN